MPPIPAKKKQSLPIPSDDFEGIRYEDGKPTFYFSLKWKEAIQKWEVQRVEMAGNCISSTVPPVRSVTPSGIVTNGTGESSNARSNQSARSADAPVSPPIPPPASGPTIVQIGAVQGQTAPMTGNAPSSPQNLSTERKSAKETIPSKLAKPLASTTLPIQRAATTETIRGIEIVRRGDKCTVFGFPTSRIIQWMGSKGWTPQQVYRAMRILKLTGVSDTSVELLRKVGAKGKASPTFKEITLSIKQRNLLTAVSEDK